MTPAIPGTRSLKLLEAVGQRLNFTRAADDLGLTPAAVSYGVKEIEDQLGAALFTRTSRSVQPTEAGMIFLDAAANALAELERAGARIRRQARGGASLRLTTEPTFASKWLIPRMGAFRRENAAIDLRIDVSDSLRDFDLDDIDMAVRFGRGDYPGLVSEQLFENLVIPVCSPEMLSGPSPLREPRDLLTHTLCQVDWTLGGVTWPNWRMWMAAVGIDDFDDRNCIVFSDTAFAVQAAIYGEAVALAEKVMVEADLAAGRLVQPFELGLTTPFHYFLVYPESLRSDDRIQTFRHWLRQQIDKPVTPDARPSSS